MHRNIRSTTVILIGLVCILILSAPKPASGSQPSPRDNPEFRDKFSSIVLLDPAWASAPLPALPLSLGDVLETLGIVPTGPNVLANQDPTTQAQNEPSIDVNPADPNHIIATSNDYRLRVDPPPEHDVRAGYYVSFDGGHTWQGDGIIDISTIPNTFAAGDPAIAIHDLNNVYYSYIAFNRITNDGGVAVSKSTDGGLTWLNPVVVDWNSNYEFQDKEYLAVDATGGPYDGNVYVTWTNFSSGAPIYFSRSTSGGASFSIPYQVSDAYYYSNQGSIPAVGPDGILYVIWYSYDTGGLRMAKSTNGGQSFGLPFAVASVDEIPSPLPGGGFRDNSYPTMAVDQNNGTIYVAWSDFRNNDADIYFTRSTNQGFTWSIPMRINDDPLYNNAHQFFPWVDVAPNGKVYVGWFDSRLDPTPLVTPMLYDEYVTVSSDGGLTFSTNQRISEVTSDSSVGGFNPPFIGDYSGIAATDNFVYPAWVDSRRNQLDIFTQTMQTIQGQKLAPTWVEPVIPFTYTINLNSAADIDGNQLEDPLPMPVTYVPGSAQASSGMVDFADDTLTWTGDITASLPITITFGVTPTGVACQPISNVAHLLTGQGLSSDLSATSYITGPLPAPEFSWIDSELVFSFTNQTPGPSPYDFAWSFGDGFTSTETSPIHEYAAPGQYTVAMEASNACGVAQVEHLVDASCSAPQAYFGWTHAALTVSFTDESTGKPPLTYAWDFGDGHTSSKASPIHLYDSPGRYLVGLLVTSVCGTDEFQTSVIAGNYIFLPISNNQ